ncbi:MAG TPA: hypothetical protein VGM84_27140 [Steroidobacteraceae bacterium]|jgi:hypothetical protein
MSNASLDRLYALKNSTWADVLGLAAYVAICLLIWKYRPLAHLFADERLDAGGYLVIETTGLLIGWVIAKMILVRAFFRDQQRAEHDAAVTALRAGRVERASLLTRCVVQLVVLGLVTLGWIAHQQDGSWWGLLAFVPVFIVFALAELSVTLRPGDRLVPDLHDELLQFFRTRMLRAGYLTALACMLVVFLATLIAPAYASLLVLVGLSVTLLVPGFSYVRLDREAAKGE